MSRFLTAYQTFVSKSTDAPYEFTHTSGLMCLSSIAVGRRRIDRGSGIHPNLFALLVAGSSKDRKSTCVDLGVKILKEVAPDRVGPGDFTAEGLIGYMKRRPKVVGKGTRNKLLLPMPEFGTYLAASRGYAANLSAVLCQLYDGQDFERVRSGKRPLKIEKPRVSLFGGVAYGMLEKFADPQDWVTGFFARFVFIIPGQHRPARNPVQPAFPLTEYGIAKAALDDLQKELKATPGPMVATTQAEQLLVQFSNFFAPFTVDDPVVAAQAERYLNIVWKLAMLYQIDDNPKAPIGVNAMNNAISYVQAAWSSFLSIYGATAGTNFSRVLGKVDQKIEGAGSSGVSKRDLSKTFKLTSELLVPILDTLVKMGRVEIKKVATKGGGPVREVCFSIAD